MANTDLTPVSEHFWQTYPQTTYTNPVNYVYWYPPTPRCAWCQGTHTDKCPRLKLVKYREDGTVEHIEFFPAKDA